MEQEKLKTLRIDIDKGIYEVNGRDISNIGTYMNLIFEDGNWSLMVTENKFYSALCHEIKE